MFKEEEEEEGINKLISQSTEAANAMTAIPVPSLLPISMEMYHLWPFEAQFPAQETWLFLTFLNLSGYYSGTIHSENLPESLLALPTIAIFVAVANRL